jgi:hypothetical protein
MDLDSPVVSRRAVRAAKSRSGDFGLFGAVEVQEVHDMARLGEVGTLPDQLVKEEEVLVAKTQLR